MKHWRFLSFSISFTVITLSIFGFSSPAYAQFNKIPQSQINVEMFPENPGPNQIVDVTLTSYDTNINEATITWTVNGKVQKTGKGEKHFQFTTGNMNTTTTLRVKAVTVLGEVVDQTFSIKPVSVDMLWQSDSFVPPFYKGKPMFSYQNTITFIALPHITAPGGGEVPAKTLVYKWSVNGSVVDAASGYGKNTYTTSGALMPRALDVSVDVTGGDATGFARVVATPGNPSLILYKKDPLYGIEFQNALTGVVSLANVKEVALLGMPYFFSMRDSSSPALTYIWAINGTPITSSSNSNLQTFRPKEGTKGQSVISLRAEHNSKVLQSASNQFNLEFDTTGTDDTTNP